MLAVQREPGTGGQFQSSMEECKGLATIGFTKQPIKCHFLSQKLERRKKCHLRLLGFPVRFGQSVVLQKREIFIREYTSQLKSKVTCKYLRFQPKISMYIVLTECQVASKFRLPLWKTNSRLADLKGFGSQYIFLMFFYMVLFQNFLVAWRIHSILEGFCSIKWRWVQRLFLPA